MFNKESIAYLRESIGQGRVSRGPLDLQVLPTTRCNAACGFCPQQMVSRAGMAQFAPRWLAKPQDINFGVLDRMMDDLYRMGGLKRIHITGGEPLLYKRIMTVIFLFRRTFPNAEIALVTNGILLEEFAVALAHSGLDRISISVNAGTEQSFQTQARAKGASLDKISRGIKLVRAERNKKSAAKPSLSVTLVLNRHNFREVEQALEFGINAGADAVSYIPLMDCAFPGEPPRELALTGDEFTEFSAAIEKHQAAAKPHGIYLGFTGRAEDQGKIKSGETYRTTSCYAGYSFAMVWPDGSVRPCCNCEQSLGNLHEQSFYRIWNSEAAQQARERMRKIAEQGAPALCDCVECGYLYENREFDRLVKGHE